MKQMAYVGEDDKSTHLKPQNAKIGTPLLVVLETPISKKGDSFKNKTLKFEITNKETGGIGDVTMLESTMENGQRGSMLDSNTNKIESNLNEQGDKCRF